MRQISSFFVLTSIVLMMSACNKVKKDDPRQKYVGSWNFKQTTFTFSGYYDYNVPPGTSPQYIMNTTTNVQYDDNTGSISLGKEEDQLILKYCSNCAERVIDINLNASGSWTLNEKDFVDYVQPGPGGYSSYYATITIEGAKL